MPEPKRINVAMRVPPHKLEAIDARAAASGTTRTEYMIRAALGEAEPSELQAQINDLSRRLERLERLVEIGGMQ